MSTFEISGCTAGLSYPPASGPVAGTVIRTDATGLTASLTMIPVGEHLMRVYLARPDNDRDDLPIVLVVPDAYGLHEHAADVARRFAREDYLAVAPDLLSSQGDPNTFTDVGKLLTDVLQHIPDQQVMVDLDACAEWAATQGGDRDRLAIVGFSWGGRWAWLYAAHAALAAAVVWYGILDGVGSGLYPTSRRDLFPQHPLDVADHLRTPVLGLYGGDDAIIPIDTVEAARAAAARRGPGASDAEIVVFDGAPHDFHADYREPYREGQAKESWFLALRWLRSHGV